MARQLTPLGVVVVSIFKWIAIPLIAALIGFKIIGPLIGGPAAKPAEKKEDTSHLSEKGKKFQSVRNPGR